MGKSIVGKRRDTGMATIMRDAGQGSSREVQPKDAPMGWKLCPEKSIRQASEKPFGKLKMRN